MQTLIVLKHERAAAHWWPEIESELKRIGELEQQSLVVPGQPEGNASQPARAA
jgi:hypothetical protein